MNARIYDPVIGRFTSPDTMIPHPDRIQAYNRYVYVYGNPIKYSDPSGHFISFLIGAAIFAIAATSDDPVIHKFGMLLGQLMMMGADMGMSAMAQGATVGFTTSFIASGGDMGKAIQGALTTALSTGLSQGIGEAFGHGFSLEGAFVHGTVQGMISVMRGGKFQNGFINGFLGKISGSLTKSLFAGASPDAMTFGGGAVATIMGGIAAEATGGEFSEGALTAMVVFLYNEIGHVDKKFKKSMNELQSSKKGLALIRRALRSKVMINIYDRNNVQEEDKEFFASGGGKGQRNITVMHMHKGGIVSANIYLDASVISRLKVYAVGAKGVGYYPISLERALAHELGHAVSGLGDYSDSPAGMTIVHRFENPVMYPLDGMTRIKY